MENIKTLFEQKKSYTDFLRKQADSKKYVVFYGCGNSLESIWLVWNKYVKRKIDFVCDANPDKWGARFCGLPCLSIKELQEIKDDVVVFLTLGAVDAAATNLNESGILNVLPIYKYNILWENVFDADDYDDMIPKFSETLQIFADAKSKVVLNTVLRRYFYDFCSAKLMKSISDPDTYFPEDVYELSSAESFADIGAFDGDSIKEFIKHTGGKFANIYAFELCKENFQKLISNTEVFNKNGNLEYYNVGCWHCRQIVHYAEKSDQSMIVASDDGLTGNDDLLHEDKCDRTAVDKLDQLLTAEKDGSQKPVTLIKMDIEGAEMNALRGAENIIRTQKPKMAVCVYHDLRHLYEVPLYLKSLVPEYKIYFRHHTEDCYETVCYAVL